MIVPCWCGSSSCQCRSGSQNFEDAVNRSIGAAVADPDRDDAIDPVVLRGGSLKYGSYPEIVAHRIDDLAFLDSRDEFGRTVADTLVCHADQRIVVCLEDKPNI